jgi:hypothetical protein
MTMASVRKDIVLRRPADYVWRAVRDFGAIHERLARGFIVNSVRDRDARLVTFANGVVVREQLVSLDDAARRLAYAAVWCRAAHHHATMEVFPEPRGARSRLVWIQDVLPDRLAAGMRELVELGAEAIHRTLE